MTLTEDQVNKIASHYGLKVNNISSPISGYRSEVWPFVTDKEQLILILYKNEASIVLHIRLANAIGKYLDSNEMPARQTADSRIIKIQAGKVSRYVSVYKYLKGSTIPWEAYTMNHLKLLGWAMSDMHYYLAQAPFDMASVTEEYRQNVGRMHKYFDKPDVRAALLTKLNLRCADIESFAQVLNDCDSLPGQHGLHMDFVRGNVLFQTAGNSTSKYTLGKHSLSGILDFEKSSLGSPIIDIARTIAFLLVDCKYKTENKIRKYFLESGYNKRGQANYESSPFLEPLINLFLYYDFYKFLKHNPYEDLDQNEHFERTKLLLIKRGLLVNEDGKIL